MLASKYSDCNEMKELYGFSITEEKEEEEEEEKQQQQYEHEHKHEHEHEHKHGEFTIQRYL